MNTVFITGAAHGIGLATAKLFAAQGWFVGLYDINEDGLERMLASGEFPHACAAPCDVSSRPSIEAAFEHFVDHSGGKLDVLVNNAGVLTSGEFEHIDPAAHDRIIDVNIRGLTHVAQVAFPLLKDTPKSTIVNLCSVSSVHGVPMLAVYSASKYYVNGLTEALHIEWAQHGIRVASVKPPLVNTAMAASVRPELMQKLKIDMEPEHVAQAILRTVQGKRVGYLLGRKARLWGIVDKCLPEAGRKRLTRWLAGY